MLQIRHDSFKLGLWKILSTFSLKRRYFLTGRWDPEEYRSTFSSSGVDCDRSPVQPVVSCDSLTHSFIHSLTHSRIHSLTHSPTHLRTHSLTHPPTHSSTHSLTLTHPHSINQSLSFTHSCHWFTHPHPHSLNHRVKPPKLTHSLIHSFTPHPHPHSLTHWLTHPSPR